MFVIKFDDTWFKFLEKTSFRFTPKKEEAEVFHDYAHAESVIKSLARAGINRLSICVHRSGRPKIPTLSIVK